ncbi:hypothetical protein C8Q74DRAFT_1202298 [Fomes fomentarius]|nr:hypothetical protein C8Q74DRAFT_1202298 [Fomes fomentarius]
MTLPCSVCFQDATLVCSGCKLQRYCSDACQLANWKAHKKGCKIQQKLNKVNAEHDSKPRSRPSSGICTGCNVKFREDYPCEGLCSKCGYAACESCVCHDSRVGTCFCAGSNFDRKYCEMEPQWYHTDGNGRAYTGDRHPDPFDGPYRDEVYEPEPRACNNCGKVTKVFKAEYRRP